MNKTSTRGRTFTGIVTSNKMSKTVTVEWTRRHYIPKYERYETRRTRVKAHDETDAEIGDIVIIKETRPLSKTKNFIVIKNLKNKGGSTEAALQEAESLDSEDIEKIESELNEQDTKQEEKKSAPKKTTKKTSPKKKDEDPKADKAEVAK